MPELNGYAFADFFRALWDQEPFTWQIALAERVMAANRLTVDPTCGSAEKAGWPEAIALPTAAGKTACMDIAVYALAAQVDHLDAGLPLTTPRRIFFVVDRRVIVDEAFERARSLALRLARAKNGILKTVADRLRKLSDGDLPLAAHHLRGGTLRSEAWARSPVLPLWLN